MRNGRKFNILEVMRYLLIIFLGMCLPLNSFAQNTQITDAPLSLPSITLDVKVVEILLNDEHRKGIDWEAIVSDYHSLQLKKEDNLALMDKKYQLSAGAVSNEDYEVLLDALDTVGKFISHDFSQVILNKNESKNIDISPDPQGLPKIALDLKWVNSPSGEDKLQIDPLLHIMIKDHNNVAAKAILTSQTQMNLKDNATIVIGGLMHEQEISKVKKFPLLGDLPLVGLVFRKQGKLMQITETIIFMTVHMNSVQMPSDEGK